MRTILAIICFLATIIHGLFGYYIHFKGESLFEPEGMIVAVEKKAPSGAVSYDVFKAVNPNSVEEAKVQETVESPAVESQSPESKTAESTAVAEEPQKTNEITPPVVASTPKAEPTATAPAKEAPWWKRMLQKKDTSQLVKQGEVNQDENGKFVPANSNKEGAKEIIGFKTGWIGFLQVENAMVGLIAFILGIAVCCVKGKGKTSRWVFFWNLLFWTGLTGLLVLFEPVNTPLSMVKVGYAYPQWILISGMTGLGAILSLLLILFSFGGQKEVQVVKKVIVEEHTKKVESAPQPETKPVPAKPSFLKRMFKGKKEQPAPEIRKAPVMEEPNVPNKEPKEVIQKSSVKEETPEADRFHISKSVSISDSRPDTVSTKKEASEKSSDSVQTKPKAAEPVKQVAKPQDAPIQEKKVEQKKAPEAKSVPLKETKESIEQSEKTEEKSVTIVPEVSSEPKQEGKVSQAEENASSKEDELPAVIIPPAPVKESKKEEAKELNKENTQNKD